MNEGRFSLDTHGFGSRSAVVGSGDEIVVAADVFSSDGLKDRGSISSYRMRSIPEREQRRRNSPPLEWVPQSAIHGPNEWDEFGSDISVASNGQAMVVGALGDDRFHCWAAILLWNDNGWDFAQNFSRKADPDSGKSPVPSSVSVGISGDGSRVVVGSACDEADGTKLQGQVFTLNHDHGEWIAEEPLTLPEPTENAGFGATVELSDTGTVLAVSTSGESLSKEFTNTVSIYERENLSWVLREVLTGETPNEEAFGESVSLSSDGSVIVVGSSFYGDEEGGAVYLFERTGDHWGLIETFHESNLKPTRGEEPNAEPDISRFGEVVQISATGDTVVASNHFGTTHGQGFAGWVAVFHRHELGWTQTSMISGSKTGLGFGSGLSLSTDGSLLVAGAAERIFVLIADGTRWHWIQMIAPDFEYEFDKRQPSY